MSKIFFRFSRWQLATMFNFEDKIWLAEEVCRIETLHHAKFCWSWSIYSADIAIFWYFKMATAAILNFKNCTVLLANRVAEPTRITVPNFVKIGQSVWWYCNLSIFQHGGRRRLGFLRSQNFIVWQGPEGRDASACQILSKLVNRLQRHSGIFFIFQDGGRLPSSICFWGIFGLSIQNEYLGGLNHSVKFGYDRCSSFDNMNVSIFGDLAGKCLLTPPKLGFWGYLTP